MKFDETLYTMLCTEYEKAVREGLEQFSLDGQPILTSYAKYLIEYLSPYFGKEKS